MANSAFRSHLQVNLIPGEGVLLLSERGAWALHGKLYELLAPLIDGSRDDDEIVDALAGTIDPPKVYYALGLLRKHGYITDSVPEVSGRTAAFWHGMGIEPRTALKALASKRVRVRAVGEIDPAPLLKALSDIGITSADDETADFEVVIADDYLRRDLDALNKAALQANRPWLLTMPLGHEPWLGPLFVPGNTGCYGCLALQLRRNRPAHRFVEEKLNLPEPPVSARAANPATFNAACQLAAVEVAKCLAGAQGGLEGKVLSLDVRTWTAVGHYLLRNPACPACGAAVEAKAAPVELTHRKAAFIRDCGQRSEPPEETLKRYQHLVSPITGVVTTLAPVLDGNGPVYVYVSGHNPSLKMQDLDFLKASLRNGSGGKGTTELQAKTSALCEAIERYSGERRGAELVMTATYHEMRQRFGADTIHPNQVMLYSDRQLAEHAFWNAKKSKFNRVPQPLDESVPIDWTPVWSLTHRRHKYLPTQLVYYRSKASANSESYYCVGCSNGNASGNNLEEAVVQGFCELVERDAVALWWYNRLRKPAVAWESFDDPYFDALIRDYRSRDREAWALDLTSDLGLPAFVAASRLCAGSEERLLFGFGCHLNPCIALQRAFAEMNQMLAFAGAIGEPGLPEHSRPVIEDEDTVAWLKTATLANQPYMAPDENIAPKRLQDYQRLSSDDLLEDITLCRGIVEQRGMEVLVLDQTRPETKMPVVKVIVPGLRHFWARYAPGRLYDVPVQMGWLPKPLAEEELNPVPVFF